MRAAPTVSALRNKGLCGRRPDRLQLMRKSLGGQAEIALLCVLQAG
jgi:hypothetical protein